LLKAHNVNKDWSPYCNTNGIITIKKHIKAKHLILSKILLKKQTSQQHAQCTDNLLRRSLQFDTTPSLIFLVMWIHLKRIMNNLTLFVTKSLHIVECVWLQRLTLQLSLQVVFRSNKIFHLIWWKRQKIPVYD
jgi:hypothetical protein